MHNQLDMDSVRHYARAVVKKIVADNNPSELDEAAKSQSVQQLAVRTPVVARKQFAKKSLEPVGTNLGRSGNCTHDLTKAFSLLALCVGLIVKGVSYDNSHWANQDELDVVNNKDQFPIMTSFIDNIKAGKHENCEDPKCRIFFDKYAALQTLAAARGGSGSVPLRGRASRGVNRRCEHIALAPSSESPVGTSSVSKYEKCTVDKQTEINEFKTIRYLLIASMICDAMGLLNWVAILTYSGHPSRSGLARLFLVTSALCGFIAALLTCLGLGLFAQAVDIFEDPRLYLGWPFYAVCASALLSLITAFTGAARLQRASNQIDIVSRRNVITPTISVIDLASDEFEAYPISIPGPAPYRYAYGYARKMQHHQQQQQAVKAITPSSSGASSTAFYDDETADLTLRSNPVDSNDQITNEPNHPFRSNARNINSNSINKNDPNSVFRRV